MPHIRLAPAAARMPRTACCPAEAWPAEVLNPQHDRRDDDSNGSQDHLADVLRVCAFKLLEEDAAPEESDEELAFQSGNATARLTSRMAKTVRVFATAQSAPASRAQTIRCFPPSASVKT